MAEEQEIKKRRITDKDFDVIEKFVSDELKARETNAFRKSHERKWKEVDRQVEMEPPRRVSADGREIKGDWTSALEMGELSKASEIIAADVMRITFSNPNWLEAHVDIEGTVNTETGKTQLAEGAQERADGILRALLNQQHKDFGLKPRFKLSIKEALHHGSFVAEARQDSQLMSYGAKVKTIEAPVWQPYSMWNAYPDSSPSVIGTNLFYTGSMILVDFMPLWKLKRRKSAGWIQSRIKRVKKEEHKDGKNETQDVKLVKYYGDVSIERGDGDIFLPNMKIILANGKLVFAEVNDLPYPPVIYAGYERQDVRDPYYTSPIIKQSPTQKLTTVLANEFIDAVRLRTKPPIEYDANDPDYVASGGPDLSPGGKSATKSMGKGMKTMEVGDPQSALAGMQFGFRQLQEGLGVSSLRHGTATSDRQTATEAKLMEQGSEVRTIDFIGSLEQQGLRPFLYMQHALNRMNLKEYTIYSDEMNTPDILRITKADIDKDAHFDVTGAKGILGEKERQQQTSNVTAFASQNPMFAPLLKPERILMDMYRDAGKKNPEEWVKTQNEGPQVPPEVMAKMQQMGQAMQAMQAELQQAQQGVKVKMAELEVKRQIAAADNARKQAELEFKRAEAMSSAKSDRAELMASIEQNRQELAFEYERMNGEFALQAAGIKKDFEARMAELAVQQQATADQIAAMKEEKKERKRKKNAE